jgi:hypothetical protein
MKRKFTFADALAGAEALREISAGREEAALAVFGAGRAGRDEQRRTRGAVRPVRRGDLGLRSLMAEPGQRVTGGLVTRFSASTQMGDSAEDL